MVKYGKEHENNLIGAADQLLEYSTQQIKYKNRQTKLKDYYILKYYTLRKSKYVF